MSSALTEFSLTPFFKITPDLVCFADKAGYFKKINHSVIEKLGYTEEELHSQPISSFIHPEDQEITRQVRQKLIGGEALVNFENRYISKTGQIIWLHWTSIYFPDDEVVFAIAKDITNRKQIELELEKKYQKYKKLTSHFKGSIENDRKYFSLELHEDISQLASVIRMDMEAIGREVEKLPADVKRRVEHASAVSELMINAIKKISLKISPYLMEELSLEESLQWLCKDFAQIAKIPCKYENHFDEAKLSNDLKLDIFRICQEALSNVMNHAEATQAIIKIEELNSSILLTISDNGKGFIPHEPILPPGLTRMQERADSINALFSIETLPGKGTKIIVEIK